MAKKIKKRESVSFLGEFDLDSRNYLLFIVGILSIFLGYILMVLGGTNGFLSLTLSPLILLISYLIIIPLAIFYGKDDDDGESIQGGKEIT